jgi:hypothetical protein
MSRAVSQTIGLRTPPAVKPGIGAPVASIGIDYLKLLATVHQAEVGQAITTGPRR